MNDQHDASDDDEQRPRLIPGDVSDSHGIQLEDGAAKNQYSSEDALAAIVAGESFDQSYDDQHHGPEAESDINWKHAELVEQQE